VSRLARARARVREIYFSCNNRARCTDRPLKVYECLRDITSSPGPFRVKLRSRELARTILRLLRSIRGWYAICKFSVGVYCTVETVTSSRNCCLINVILFASGLPPCAPREVSPRVIDRGSFASPMSFNEPALLARNPRSPAINPRSFFPTSIIIRL